MEVQVDHQALVAYVWFSCMALLVLIEKTEIRHCLCESMCLQASCVHGVCHVRALSFLLN